MKTPIFRSSLAQTMVDLVTLKRLEGFDYTAQAKALMYFDKFLHTQGYEGPTLSREIVQAYVSKTRPKAPNTRRNLLSPVRVLSRHIQQMIPDSYVLHDIGVNEPSLPRWYLYSQQDIAALLRHAQSLGPERSLRPHTFYTLIGLLSVTGLRIDEALSLNIDTVDLTQGRAFVRGGKFGKARYVALAPSTIHALGDYLSKRSSRQPASASSPFFVNHSGYRLKYSNTAATFRHMVKFCGIGRGNPRLPRLHDFRHSYACKCVLKWYDEGVDINSRLPLLATAMGHVNITNTQVYLHITSQILQRGANRFHPTFIANCRGGIQ